MAAPSRGSNSLTMIALPTATLAAFVASFSLAGGAPPTGGATPPSRPKTLQIDSLARFESQSLTLPRGIPERFTATLVLNGKPRTITVLLRSLRGAEFQLYVDIGSNVLVPVEPPPARTYRGVVEGVEGSGVAVSLIDGQLRGLIDLGSEGTYFVQPVADFTTGWPASAHVTYATSDAIAPAGVQCGLDLAGLSLPDWMDGPMEPPGGVAGAQPSIAEIGFDADFEFFQKNGNSVANTVNDIELVMNGVDFIYDRDVNIGYEFTTFVVRATSADPYTTSVMEDLLCEFRTTWNTSPESFIQRDLAQLYTGKSIIGSVIGLAWLGVTCNQTGTDCSGFGNLAYSCVESRYTTNLSLRESLSAHEIGHNWNAQHCDGNGDCHIMCSVNGGCDGIGGSNLKFGAGEVAQIVAFRNTVSCDQTSPLPLAPPFLDQFPGSAIDTTKWTYVDGAATSTNATNEPSATRSLNLNSLGSGPYDNDEIRSNAIQLGSLPTAQVSYWTEAVGVEAGEKLHVEYWSSTGDWVLLNTITSTGASETNFTQWIHTLPANALHDGFRIRFRAEVTEPNDNWYVDDVNVAQSIVPPPANDDCNAAILLSGSSTTFNTLGASPSIQTVPAMCDEGNGTTYANDIWYLVQAGCTGTLTVTTCGSANFDTRIAVYSGLQGCPAIGAAPLGCSDNYVGCSGNTSFVQVPVTQSLPYYIRVGGATGGGTGTLTWGCAPSTPPCPADRNNDHVVNGADLAVLLANGADLAIMLGAWGNCPT